MHCNSRQSGRKARVVGAATVCAESHRGNARSSVVVARVLTVFTVPEVSKVQSPGLLGEVRGALVVLEVLLRHAAVLPSIRVSFCA